MTVDCCSVNADICYLLLVLRRIAVLGGKARNHKMNRIIVETMHTLCECSRTPKNSSLNNSEKRSVLWKKETDQNDTVMMLEHMEGGLETVRRCCGDSDGVTM